MRTNWWDGMDLAAWCAQRRQLAAPASDLPFAQAVAHRRAEERGQRQRLTVEHPAHHSSPVFMVADAPEVTEPCS